MSEKRCKNCYYWDVHERSEGCSGFCRGKLPDTGGTWPTTKSTDWCAYFRKLSTEQALDRYIGDPNPHGDRPMSTANGEGTGLRMLTIVGVEEVLVDKAPNR